MKLSSYSNNCDSYLTIYQGMDVMMNDYEYYEPLMLTKFKWSRMKTLSFYSKLHTTDTEQIPLSDHGEQASYSQNKNKPLSFYNGMN